MKCKVLAVREFKNTSCPDSSLNDFVLILSDTQGNRIRMDCNISYFRGLEFETLVPGDYINLTQSENLYKVEHISEEMFFSSEEPSNNHNIPELTLSLDINNMCMLPEYFTIAGNPADMYDFVHFSKNNVNHNYCKLTVTSGGKLSVGELMEKYDLRLEEVLSIKEYLLQELGEHCYCHGCNCKRA